MRISPITNTYLMHDGIDISVSKGSSVFNMIDGTVLDTGYDETFGCFVHILISEDVYISYNHLDEILVKEGDTLKSGDIIAKSGNTGSSTGPHLHLSLFVSGVSKDILPFVKYPYTDNFYKEYVYRGESFVYETTY